MISLSRHSRESGNPDNQTRRVAAQQHGFVRCAGCLSLLDSRVRGNDDRSEHAA
jgi:hypothetical protein